MNYLFKCLYRDLAITTEEKLEFYQKRLEDELDEKSRITQNYDDLK
jgi:hypothetical protein